MLSDDCDLRGPAGASEPLLLLVTDMRLEDASALGKVIPSLDEFVEDTLTDFFLGDFGPKNDGRLLTLAGGLRGASSNTVLPSSEPVDGSLINVVLIEIGPPFCFAFEALGLLVLNSRAENP